MARKTFEQNIEEAKERYIEAVKEVGLDGSEYHIYKSELLRDLRALRLRNLDVTYHFRDAYARATGACQEPK